MIGLEYKNSYGSDYSPLTEKLLEVVQFYYRCQSQHLRDSLFILFHKEGNTINITNK